MNILEPEENEPEREEISQRGLSKQNLIRKLVVGLGALSLVGLGASGVFWGVKNKPEWFGIKNGNLAVSQAEVQSLVSEVSKIIALPEGETPTVATVTDLEKVKSQKFFEKAQNGDKVLVYTGAKKAYLYRPSEKKIIEVGVVNINQQGEVAGGNQEIEVLSPSPTITGEATPTVTSIPLVSPTPTVKFSPTPLP